MTDIYRLLQFTDPHLYADRAGEMRGAITFDTLSQTIGTARRSHWPADAVLVTGDIAQDESRGAYENFRAAFDGLGVPVHCLPGNHDAPAYMQESLVTAPFSYCGTLELGPWLLPLLSSHTPGDAGGMLAASELERLDRLLTANPDRHAMVCLHHHPVSSGSRWLDTVPLRNAAELWDVVERHPQVRCLLWGHVHQEYEDRPAGVLLLATPSTCRQFKPNVVDFALDEGRPPAYRWIELHADGAIVTAVNWCGSSS